MKAHKEKIVNYPKSYSIKVREETRTRIDFIKGHKNGITDEIRSAIEKVVQNHFDQLKEELEAR